MDLPDFPISQSLLHINKKDFQEDAKIGIAAYTASDKDQPSPISILKASFSNDSCSFGSQNDSLGVRQHFELTESCNTTMSLDPDIDLLDSATSVDISRSDIEKTPNSTDRSSTKISAVKLLESKLSNASETILNAELLFENFCLYNSDGLAESSVKSFLLDLLETIMHAFVMEPKSRSVSKEAEERNQLKEFIFDCIIECLDLKCSRSCKSGYKMRSNFHLFLSRDRLRREIQEEIKWWMGLTGKFLDDLIEKGMNHSTGKWMEFQIEAFGTDGSGEGHTPSLS
uniref:Uncharacterized protein LOC105048414 n=1 Tax=Elaeis guineensis var. tenera TaxID=51953 RepID=A0A6I9RG59_ELAGV|nr:uncharacterized protein LOC105048414 [Elaeis guineensis]